MSVTSSRGSIERDLTLVGEAFLGVFMAPRSVAFFRTVLAEAFRQPSLGQLLYENGPKASAEYLAVMLSRAHEAGELQVEDPILAAHQFFTLCKTEAEGRLFFAVAAEFSPIELKTFVGRALKTFLRAYAPASRQPTK